MFQKDFHKILKTKVNN